MGKHEIGKSVYMIAFAISIGLFIGGILMGYLLATFRNSIVSRMITEANLRVEDLMLMEGLIGEDCGIVRKAVDRITMEMKRVEDEIAVISNGRQPEKIGLEELRKRYHLLSMRYYLYTQRFGECLRDRAVVIYFYSKDCKECRDEGIILTALKRKYGEKLLVFPFDLSIGLASVEALASSFNITSAPSLVINGKVMRGFVGKDEIESELVLKPVSPQ